MSAVNSVHRGSRAIALRTAALLVGVALLVAGCVSTGGGSAGGGSGSTTNATLTLWTINLKKTFGGYIGGLISSYEKAHPGIHITWVDVPGADIATKLLSAIAGGTVPDVVNIDSPNLGPFTDKMADLSKYLPASALSDYQPGLLNSLRSNGKLTAIPWYNGGAPVGVYDMNIMSKVGFDPATPPTDYPQVLSLAQRVYDTTKVYGTNEIPSIVTGSTAVLPYEGVPLLSPDKKTAAFDTPAGIQVLNQFRQAYVKHAIAPGAVSADIRNFPQTLDNSQIGFQADAFPFVLTTLQANSPSVYQHIAVTKAPTTQDGKYLLLGQQTLAVPAASKHQAAAADFIRFVTNGANQLAFCKLVAIYPSTVSTTKDPFFTDITDTSPIGQARKVIVEELPNLVDGELGTGKDTELSDDLSQQVRSFMQGSTSASAALSTAAAQWNKALAAQ
ncbi:MAG TPA: extracellular solute-binding protein [Pseudonocardiaceae bacterium]|jgi:multiple sugar transport system substrate-binding protein/putative chitobiose transport system substrate-binding protein